MSEIDSIGKMSAGIAAAIAAGDWAKALRRSERIKGILLEATVQDNPEVIRAAAKAIQENEKRLELSEQSPAPLNSAAVMWQLRSDATTAALAARMRPITPRPISAADTADLPDQLFRVLQSSNGAMTNSDLAIRMGKDPAIIARGLKTLERRKAIRSWKTGGRRFNLPASRLGVQADTVYNGELFKLTRHNRHEVSSQKAEVINGKTRPIANPIYVDNSNQSKKMLASLRQS